MANFVLVHGAWHGGWCWQRVVQALAAAGHRAHAVTLTGLGERAHLLSPAITLETHITDVISAIQMEEMDEVVLAVHSYAGMIGTAVADRRFWDGAWLGGGGLRVVELRTGHDPMVSAPAELVEILRNAANPQIE